MRGGRQQENRGKHKMKAWISIMQGNETIWLSCDRLGMHALLKPAAFEKKGRQIPRPARPPPKLIGR